MIKGIKKYFQSIGVYLNFENCRTVNEVDGNEIGDLIEIDINNITILAKLTSFLLNVTQGEKSVSLAVGEDRVGRLYYLILGEEKNKLSEYDFSIN